MSVTGTGGLKNFFNHSLKIIYSKIKPSFTRKVLRQYNALKSFNLFNKYQIVYCDSKINYQFKIMLFDTSNISIDLINNDSLRKKNITLSVIRLDKIHPIISGNKLFKLHYFLEQAIQDRKEGVLTFGGAFSNHLVATAYACKCYKIKSIGFVRGLRPAILSPTLLACIEYGMELVFISRAAYTQKTTKSFLNNIILQYPTYLIIPEGGYGSMGAAGAALIPPIFARECNYLCTPIGTATTFAGLLMGVLKNQQVIGVPVVKGENDIAERVLELTGKNYPCKLLEGYTFGGYAKKNNDLLQFMNSFYLNYKVPTDFVYTAKMMFAVLDKIENNYFEPGSNIACLHTGGLQGNQSLLPGTLTF